MTVESKTSVSAGDVAGVRLGQVLDLLLKEYQDATEALAAAEAARAQAAAHRIGLRRAADPVIEALPDGERRPMTLRFHEVDVAYRQDRARPSSGARAEILRFLHDWPEDTLRPADLRHHLARRGEDAGRKYCSNRLAALADSGHLTRETHGTYRINRTHHDFVALDLAGVG